MIKTMRNFPLHAPPYPCNKSASRGKNEEEDEDGNGKLGLFELGQSIQQGMTRYPQIATVQLFSLTHIRSAMPNHRFVNDVYEKLTGWTTLMQIN